MEQTNELYHYGKLGMRWGRHKFQDRYGGLNKAGSEKTKKLLSEYKKLAKITTLSKAGTKRLANVEKEYNHLTGKKIGADEPNTKSDNVGPSRKTKSIQDMTNEELSSYNTRKQLETTYLGYQPKARVSKGKQVVGFLAKKVALPVAIDIGKAYLTSLGVDKVTGADMSNAQAKAKTAAVEGIPKSVEKVLNKMKS